jgi:hypothetical protein
VFGRVKEIHGRLRSEVRRRAVRAAREARRMAKPSARRPVDA